MDLSKQEMELFLLPIHLHSKNFFYHVLIRRASLTIMFYSLKIVITLIIWNKIVRPLVIINLWLAKHCVMFYSSFFSLIFSICTRPCTPAQYPLTLPGQGGVLLNFAMQDQESSGLLDGQWMFTDNYLTKLSSLVQQPPTDL